MKSLFKLFALLFLFNINAINAQVGIGNINPKSILDLSSSNSASPSSIDGLLVPRMSVFPSANPVVDQHSMIIYLTTDLTGVNISGTAQDYSKGFYSWDNAITNWAPLQPAATPSSNAWDLTGNSGTDGGATNFLGTTDDQPLSIRTKNGVLLNGNTNTGRVFIM